MQELQEHGLLATEAEPSPTPPSARDLADLPFLNAIFNEGLRVLPPAPSGSLRRMAHDMDVCGTVLPKGAH